MSESKKVNVRIHSNCDIKCLANIINNYHVELIEAYLNDSSFSNDQKIEIINEIIQSLKDNNLAV